MSGTRAAFLSWVRGLAERALAFPPSGSDLTSCGRPTLGYLFHLSSTPEKPLPGAITCSLETSLAKAS